MFGFSRGEAWLLKALPICLLTGALLLLVTRVAWRIATPTDFTCFAPSHQTASQVRYTNEACGSREKLQTNLSAPWSTVEIRRELDEPNRAALSTVFFLLSLALLLSVPVAVGDVLHRIVTSTHKASYKEVSVFAAIVRVLAMLLSRTVAGVFLIIAAVSVKRFELSRVMYSKAVTSASVGFLNGNFMTIFQETLPKVYCEVSLLQLGRMVNFTMSCNVNYGPHVLVSKVFVFLAWIVIIPSLVWIIVHGISMLILLLIPASRKFQLAIDDELSADLCTKDKERHSEERKLDRFD